MSSINTKGQDRGDTVTRWGVSVLAILALLLAMDTLRVFGGEQWLGAFVRVESQYFYGLFALLLPPVYLLNPRQKFLDAGLALIAIVVLLTLFLSAETALDEAWEFGAPDWVVYASLVLWLLVIEALRRAGGGALS